MNGAVPPPAPAGYREAIDRAAFIDRSARLRIEFTGAAAGDTLNGLLTNDVTSLGPGSGLYAAALTPKGKVIADLRVFARADSFLVDTSPAAAAGLLAMLKRYVNPRLARHRDVSAETGAVGVFGPQAAAIAADTTGVDAGLVGSLGEYAHVPFASESGDGVLARVPDLGVAGFEMIMPRSVTAAVAARVEAAGAARLDDAAAELLRIEAGRPEHGRDVDEGVLAQEAGFDRLGAISFEKGCYTGQETVARVHFRGHVNRTLRGLVAAAALAPGATLRSGDAAVGDVRSTATSPRFGHIALAYVRREVADGGEVLALSGGEEIRAQVVPLPFTTGREPG